MGEKLRKQIRFISVLPGDVIPVNGVCVLVLGGWVGGGGGGGGSGGVHDSGETGNGS